MGDCANIFVVDRPPLTPDGNEVEGIYLYTHWKGYEWPERLRLALNSRPARNRWDDPQYLTRILVSHLFQDLGLSEIGGGISTFVGDNSCPIIVLDIPGQAVAFVREGQETDRGYHFFNRMSFEDYCDQVEAVYPFD